MKNLVLTILVLLASASSYAGKGEGGGGNIIKSTPAEVKNAIQQSGLGYRWLLKELRAEITEGNSLQIRNPKLRKIFTDITSLKEVSDMLDKNQGIFMIESTDGPCMHEGKPNDSSISQAEGEVPRICMSIPRLRQYPKEALTTQIAALVVHEFSHLAGYTENIARNVVQPFALSLMARDCNLEMYLESTDEAKQTPGEKKARIFTPPGQYQNVLVADRIVIYLREFDKFITSDSGTIVEYEANWGGYSSNVKTAVETTLEFNKTILNRNSISSTFTYRDVNGKLALTTLKVKNPRRDNLGNVSFDSGSFYPEVKIAGKKRKLDRVSYSQECFN